MQLTQDFKALQLELMVMLGSHSLEVSSNLHQNSLVSSEDPHHLIAQTKNPYVSQFSYPPSALHDPISQSLEESYLKISIVKHKFFSFCMLSKFGSLKYFSYMSCC